MARKAKPKSPLQELADQADTALALCWERLGAKTLTPEDIETMVRAWRTKRLAWIESQETKQAKKEEKDSDQAT